MTAQLQTQRQSVRSDLGQARQNVAVGGGVAGVSDAQKTQSSSHFSNAEIQSIKGWYAKKNYTKEFIKEFQRVVGTKDDGDVGKLTINAVYDWQVKEGLTPLDGKFGGGCAAHAGLTVKTNNGSSSNSGGGSAGGSQTGQEAPTGAGINPKPTRYAQGDYPNSPYVTNEYYTQMKEAMGDTPYEQWNCNDANSPIYRLYQSAKRANYGDKSSIASSGCGIVSFASLKGWTPTQAAEYGMQNGSRKWGGLNRSFYVANGGTPMSANDGLNEVRNNGKYMIACMTSACNNYWTTGGHFILVYGYDGTNVYVVDSGGRNRTQAPKSTFTGAFADGHVFSR